MQQPLTFKGKITRKAGLKADSPTEAISVQLENRRSIRGKILEGQTKGKGKQEVINWEAWRWKQHWFKLILTAHLVLLFD